MYAYAREQPAALRALDGDHERPYLDQPERLEYPTETWAAQDMRKSEVFKLARCTPRRRNGEMFSNAAVLFRLLRSLPA